MSRFCSAIAPLRMDRRPASASTKSFWPLPATPAMPTISPACTAKLTPRTASRWASPCGLRTCRSVTCSTTPPILAGGLLTCRITLRPTMAREIWAGEVCAVSNVLTTAPSRSTVARSLISITSFNLWVMKIIVLPLSAKRRSTKNSSRSSCGVSTAVGSSRIKISALRYSVLRISTRWRVPTGKSRTLALGSIVRPYCSDNSRTRWRA